MISLLSNQTRASLDSVETREEKENIYHRQIYIDLSKKKDNTSTLFRPGFAKILDSALFLSILSALLLGLPVINEKDAKRIISIICPYRECQTKPRQFVL